MKDITLKHNGKTYILTFYPCGNFARVECGGDIRDVKFDGETLWADFIHRLERIF